MLNKEKSINEHFAKVQLYRWFQLYERELSTTRVNNQLDLLADDVYIENQEDQIKGKENYPNKLMGLRYWKNAHHIKNIRVTDVNLSLMSVEADVGYQNIQEFGHKSSYIIHYKAEMEQGTDSLPVFKNIKLVPILKTKLAFEDTYSQNRIKSLIHYFLGNLEKLDGDASPFNEILDEDFEINSLSTGLIDSKKKFELGLKENSKKFKRSTFNLKEYRIVELEKNKYKLEMYVNWDGINFKDEKMSKKIKHTWLITDDETQRFAKIKQAKVEVV
jgi:hypothetical protein